MLTAKELEATNLGSLTTLQVGGAFTYMTDPSLPDQLSTHIFIKKLPFTARDVLNSKPGLCTPEVYAAQFGKPSSLLPGLKKMLIAMGLVSKVLFV